MKGFYIWEDESTKGMARCAALSGVYHTITTEISPCETKDSINAFGVIGKTTDAKCNNKDNYDIEVGALISLMRMAGKEKVEHAYRETFFPKGVYERCPYYTSCKGSELHDLNIKNAKLKKGNEELYRSNSKLRAEVNSLKTANGDLTKELERGSKAMAEAAVTMDKLNDKYNKVVWGLNMAKELDEHRVNEIDKLKKELNSIYGVRILAKGSVLDFKPGESCTFTFTGGKLTETGEKLLRKGYIDTDSFDTIKYPKPTSKPRIKFWHDIKNGKIEYVRVRKENIQEFLTYAETHRLVWNGGQAPTQWMAWPCWRNYDALLFQIEGGNRLTWNDYDENDPECQVGFTDYVPYADAKLFMRGKYYVKVEKEDWLDFRAWCIRVVGVHPYLLDPYFNINGYCIFSYNKSLKDITLMTDGLKWDKPVYNWRDMQ